MCCQSHLWVRARPHGGASHLWVRARPHGGASHLWVRAWPHGGASPSLVHGDVFSYNTLTWILFWYCVYIWVWFVIVIFFLVCTVPEIFPLCADGWNKEVFEFGLLLWYNMFWNLFSRCETNGVVSQVVQVAVCRLVLYTVTCFHITCFHITCF